MDRSIFKRPKHKGCMSLPSNTKHQAGTKLVERNARSPDQKKLPKNIKTKFYNLETPIFPNGVS